MSKCMCVYMCVCVCVCAPHGLGQINEAGRDLLNFLLLNEVTICNSWFQKKTIYKQTWKHPKSKAWHCIDYTVVWQIDHRKCMDASVKWGTECHTDHQLPRLKMKMDRNWTYYKKRQKVMRYDVSKLLTRPGVNVESTPCMLFQEAASSKAREAWKKDSFIEEKSLQISNEWDG